MNGTELKIQLFADGANRQDILELYKNPMIKGFTTNPTLMKKAGISDYKAFALDILGEIKDRGISFEVFADEFDDMKRQALEIKSWADNVYVKIPVMNTKQTFCGPLLSELSEQGVKLNVTAIFTLEQVRDVVASLKGDTPAIISVFAGRIADTGADPVPVMRAALELCKMRPNTELLWASTRELFNVIEADRIGCDIITATPDILNKLKNLNKDLDAFSLETVKMFYEDATKAGFKI